MPDIAYTIVWTPEAVAELRKLPDHDILATLNNITSLARTPYPPFSGRLDVEDDLFALKVGSISVTYEVLGLTIRILDIAPLKRA